ncbi:MAG: aromatic amino acid transport family protein [archaeon]
MAKLYSAVTALTGTIIGAGFLGIPYVAMKAGYPAAILIMIIIASIMITTKLYLGEIAMRTKTNHQLSGYAEKYLGIKGKYLMFIATAFGIYAAILAYLIALGQSFSFLFFGNTTYQFSIGILVWIIISGIAYYGIKAMEEGEKIGFVLLLILVVSIVIYGWNKINISNLTYIQSNNFFIPFGVILFAFLGFSAIPEVERILGKDRHLMKRTIWIANIITFTVYAIFTAIVLGMKGTSTPALATLALGKPFVLLGIITMLTSYLALSVALIDNLRFDFKKSKNFSWFWVIIVPIILFIILELFNVANFTSILGIGGTISGGLTAILILFMVKYAKEKGNQTPAYSMPYSKYLVWILIILFVAATILELI